MCPGNVNQICFTKVRTTLRGQVVDVKLKPYSIFNTIKQKIEGYTKPLVFQTRICMLMNGKSLMYVQLGLGQMLLFQEQNLVLSTLVCFAK